MSKRTKATARPEEADALLQGIIDLMVPGDAIADITADLEAMGAADPDRCRDRGQRLMAALEEHSCWVYRCWVHPASPAERVYLAHDSITKPSIDTLHRERLKTHKAAWLQPSLHGLR